MSGLGVGSHLLISLIEFRVLFVRFRFACPFNCVHRLGCLIVCSVGASSVCAFGAFSRSIVSCPMVGIRFQILLWFAGNHSASPPGGDQVDGLPPALRDSYSGCTA